MMERVQGFSVVLSSWLLLPGLAPPTGRWARGERCRQGRDAALPAPLSPCEQGLALRAWRKRKSPGNVY